MCAKFGLNHKKVLVINVVIGYVAKTNNNRLLV